MRRDRRRDAGAAVPLCVRPEYQKAFPRRARDQVGTAAKIAPAPPARAAARRWARLDLVLEYYLAWFGCFVVARSASLKERLRSLRC